MIMYWQLFGSGETENREGSLPKRDVLYLDTMNKVQKSMSSNRSQLSNYRN
jgi:hypothetical protein